MIIVADFLLPLVVSESRFRVDPGSRNSTRPHAPGRSLRSLALVGTSTYFDLAMLYLPTFIHTNTLI